MIDIVLTLIVLHSVEGHEIRINPAQINSLRAARPKGEGGKLFTDEVKCMINTTDGKFINVIENCETVNRMLQEAR